jgi:ribose transport system permease protein
MRALLPLVLVLIALVAGFGLWTEHFLSMGTLRALASQMPASIVLATGVTIVLIAGGIDLSVGSVLGLCGAVLGHVMTTWGWPAGAAVAAGVGVGLGCGLVNGLVTVALSAPSFIVTLGMLEIARAACYLVTGSRTLYIGAPIEPIAAAGAAGVPLAFAGALLLVALVDIALRRTVAGRHLVAVGDNPRAAWAAGVDPRPVRVAAFAVAGALAGLAAVLHTSRLASADPNAGSGFELQAIAAAVVGGTSLAGGQGSAAGSLLGVLIIGVLAAGLAQAGAQEPTKRLVTGAVIVLAVAIDLWRRRRHNGRTDPFRNS